VGSAAVQGHPGWWRLIVEYKVIEAKDEAVKLQEAVNQEIQEGWEPVGGIAVGYSPTSYSWWFYQAMIKKPRP
jgi:hypothetical protein